MTTFSIAKVRAGLITAVLAVSAFSPLCQAQDAGTAVQVSVPFAFESASGQQFKAGVYTLQMENSSTLLIKGKRDSGFAMMTGVDNGDPAQAGRATFRKYGSQYFLREIAIAGKSRRIEILPSKEEKRLQKQVGAVVPAQVELALLQR